MHRAGAVDLVRAGLVTGQAPADFEARAENLAHAFGARLCRIRAAAPGRGGAGAGPRRHPGRPDRRPADHRARWTWPGCRSGRCEDGSPWRLRLAATHVLIAGATGSGKGSVIWSLIRALLPAIASGWVQVWALDPKRMELSFGRALFHRYACQAAAMVELLEAAVAEMHDRAGQFGGRTRTFTPSTEFPFVVVLVDELAFLTAYQPERDLRKRAEAAIATLTSQGRSVGVCVVGALQDPRKDVISLRNLFSTRIALRLDESDQVDMVLGDGARDRGALADQISPAALHRRRGRVRAAGGLPRPGTGPRRLRHRRRHHGHGRGGRLPARRWPMRETAWRTDEPCPVCQTGLVLVDTGGPVLRAECRLCGYAGPFDTDGTDWDGAW